MAENRPPGPDETPDIADAAGLFDDAPPKSSPTNPGGTPAVDAGESYDVVDAPEGGEGGEVSPVPRTGPPPIPGKKRPSPARGPSATTSRRDPDEAVDQVWSRWSEWGPNLVVIAAASMFMLFVVYFTLSAEQYALAFLFLMLGGFIVILLCYPIFITLERPVRVTPEQAARDFYNALSHHRPHYRRMWLLLSREGRGCSSYGSFDGFQRYWKERLAALRQGRASSTTPLKFVVEDFKAPKSAGMDEIEATFAVKVLVRGRQGEGPIETIRVSSTLVKGPDRMWYIDRGTLP